MNEGPRWITWVVVGFATVYMVAYAMIALGPSSASTSEMHVTEFGKLPVLDRGRVKPFDTVARNTMKVISGRQTFPATDEKTQETKPQPAIKWLADTLSGRVYYYHTLREARHRIENDELRALLKLKDYPADHEFSLAELQPHLHLLKPALDRLEDLKPTDYTDRDRAIRDLAIWLENCNDQAKRYAGKGYKDEVYRITSEELLGLLGLKPRSGYRYAYGEFAGKVKSDLARAHDRAQDIDADNRNAFENKVVDLANHIEAQWKLESLATPLAVPVATSGEEWESLDKALRAKLTDDRANPALDSMENILVAYAKDDAKTFNQEVASYLDRLDREMPSIMRRVRFEVYFNQLDPFYHCTVLYALMFLLVCVSWAGWTQPLNRAAFWVGVLALVVQAWAFTSRMYLLDRPFVFVTNLYSTAIFISCMGLGVALFLETVFRNSIPNLVAAVLGFVTMLIAQALSARGDTLEMMQAVLDDDFWLATHVSCVTFGYAATFVAGLLGIVFVLLGVITPALNKNVFRVLSQMIYGVVCFATLLSFVGTVLGGLWADKSWGRFWGWDPKENGALLIVLWNALILHARWGGMVKQRGVAVLAIVGNIVTAWSWFGVNMLGIGLHSYGFMAEAFKWLLIFDVSQLLFVAVGLIPTQYWRSFGNDPPKPAPPARRLRPA